MKLILQSIKPQYCELIAAGKKTIEVRKTKPKLDVPFKVYIYCSKDKLALLRDNNDTEEKYKYDHWEWAEFHQSCGMEVLGGKVIGEYVCDRIYQYTTCDFKDGTDIDDETMTKLSCLSKDEISDYEISPGQFGVFGWHISDLVIYDKPKELSEFTILCKEYDKDNPDCECCDYQSATCDCDTPPQFDCKCNGLKPLTRPPQSWCYVEEA